MNVLGAFSAGHWAALAPAEGGCHGGYRMKRIGIISKFLVLSLGIGCFAVAMMFPPQVAAFQEESSPAKDEDYSRLIEENAEHRKQVEEMDELLSVDEELEESYLAYQDSLNANPELGEYEDLLFEEMEEDSVLARLLTEFEEDAARDPEAAGRLAYMDSLLAAEPDLAEKMQELESAAAEDPDILVEHGDEMAYLCARPAEGEEFFSKEDGPYYPGSDEGMVEFVYYLEGHPRLFRAYWGLYHHISADPVLRRAVYSHWRWYWRRKHLWKSHWRYRLHAARDARAHRMVWARRVYLGRSPWQGRAVWRYHFVVVKRPMARPVLWKYQAFVARHSKYRGTVAKHRHWVRKHKSHAAETPAKTRPR